MQTTTFALADSMRRLGTESAFVVLARARALEAQGRNIIHLEIGEPDFDTPEHVKKRASIHSKEPHALLAGGGIMELREAIAKYVRRSRGVPVTPDKSSSVRAPNRSSRDAHGAAQSGRRSRHPRSRVSGLSLDHDVRRRQAGVGAAARDRRFPLRPRHARVADHAADARSSS